MKKLISLLLILIYVLTGNIIYSQDKPCSSIEASQFDFWLGEWKLEWQNEKGISETGTNTISKTMGGCVIEENFSTDDNSFIGRSISVYNPNKQYWQQTWVDNSGAYMDFTGVYNDRKMILSRRIINKLGREVIQRMVFYDIQQNEFWWNWESSSDEGKSWNLMWKIHYLRK